MRKGKYIPSGFFINLLKKFTFVLDIRDFCHSFFRFGLTLWLWPISFSAITDKLLRREISWVLSGLLTCQHLMTLTPSFLRSSSSRDCRTPDLNSYYLITLCNHLCWLNFFCSLVKCEVCWDLFFTYFSFSLPFYFFFCLYYPPIFSSNIFTETPFCPCLPLCFMHMAGICRQNKALQRNLGK